MDYTPSPAVDCRSQADTTQLPSKLSVLKLQISPRRICFLKFILEGYDGLAIITTLDAKKGFIEIRYPNILNDELFQLIDALYPSIVQKSSVES